MLIESVRFSDASPGVLLMELLRLLSTNHELSECTRFRLERRKGSCVEIGGVGWFGPSETQRSHSLTSDKPVWDLREIRVVGSVFAWIAGAEAEEEGVLVCGTITSSSESLQSPELYVSSRTSSTSILKSGLDRAINWEGNFSSLKYTSRLSKNEFVVGSYKT